MSLQKRETEDKEDLPTVVVIGAGVIGTVTTYWLSVSKRYKVICVDKGPAPASGTSKANAGRFCPSLLGDFAPKLTTLKSLLWRGAEGGIGKVDWSPAVVMWGIKYVQAASFRRYDINSTLNQLGGISTRLMDHLLKNVISLDVVSPNLWAYADNVSLAKGKEALMNTKGAKFTEISSKACTSLAAISKNVLGTNGGCLRVESDFTADAREFSVKMANACAKEFAEFRYDSRVVNVTKVEQETKFRVDLQDGTKVDCNYIVVACGPWASQFMGKWFGVDVPILPVRGASVQLNKVQNPPSVGFSDNTSGDMHFQVTPFGRDSVRLVGFADVVAPPKDEQLDVECPDSYRAALLGRARTVLPDMTWKQETPIWYELLLVMMFRIPTNYKYYLRRCGIRPISPDRLPIIGDSGVPGIFLNVGHGAIGWTLAAVSGYLLCNDMLKKHGHQPLGQDPEADQFMVDKKVGLKRFSLF
jgi:D-amino-acid dehydrogenase